MCLEYAYHSLSYTMAIPTTCIAQVYLLPPKPDIQQTQKAPTRKQTKSPPNRKKEPEINLRVCSPLLFNKL